jgi:hypothetical protein
MEDKYIQTFVTKISKTCTLKDRGENERIILRIYLREIRFKNFDSIHLAQDIDKWRTLVNTIKNFRIVQSVGNVLTTWITINFSKFTLLHGDSYLVMEVVMTYFKVIYHHCTGGAKESHLGHTEQHSPVTFDTTVFYSYSEMRPSSWVLRLYKTQACPNATLSTTNPTWVHLGLNSGRPWKNPVTNGCLCDYLRLF